jgi:hypothetical protein
MFFSALKTRSVQAPRHQRTYITTLPIATRVPSLRWTTRPSVRARSFSCVFLICWQLVFYIRNNCVCHVNGVGNKLVLNLFYRHQVLPYAIQRLKSAGYQLVTLAECLGKPPYQSVGSPGTPDVSPLPSCSHPLAFLALFLISKFSQANWHC